jgi:signal transduction histidine kinase
VKSLGRVLAGIAVAALLAGAGAAALLLSSDHQGMSGRVLAEVVGLTIFWSFVATGLYAWRRRPGNRFGALMTGVGFAFVVTALTASDNRWVFIVGGVFSSLYVAVFAHMLLAYPDGRVEPRHRWIVRSAYVLSILGPIPMLMSAHALDGCTGCPPSVLRWTGIDGVYGVIDVLTTAIAVFVVGAVVVVLVRRWRAASALLRRSLAPVLWSGVTLMVMLAGSLTSQTVGARSLNDVFGLLGLIALASVPWTFLIWLARGSVSRAGAVSRLLVRLGDVPDRGRLRDALAGALGDPSLELAFWLDDERRWVDRGGAPVTLPAGDDPTRSWTAVELEGRPVGAIVYDIALCEEPGLVRSVAAAAGLAVHNERLQAQLRARVEQLRASRARIVEAASLERRRLERNLHDGAQQRLVALSLTMRLAHNKVACDPDQARELLEGAGQELKLAQEELRELARGIHPAILSDRGLEPALEALAGRSPVPVALETVPKVRLPEPIEAAAYFVVAEALTNVAKYAGASHAVVRVSQYDGSAYVEVDDDGVGGADPARGSGLRGLVDRVGALDGKLAITSPPGGGTRLRAEIPV